MVVGGEVGFVLVVAAVAFGAELAVEGGHGFAGRGGLGLGEGLVAGRHVFVWDLVMVKVRAGEIVVLGVLIWWVMCFMVEFGSGR